MKFMGHVVKKGWSGSLGINWKDQREEEQSRGRKRMFWLTSLNEWIREREGSNIRQWS